MLRLRGRLPEHAHASVHLGRFVPVALLALVACSDFLGTNRSVVGTYDLTSLWGRPLPASISGKQETGYHIYTDFTLTIYSASLVLNADGTYVTSDSDVFVGTDRPVVFPKAGQYQTTDTSVTLESDASPALTLLRNGRALTTPGPDSSGMVFVARAK